MLYDAGSLWRGAWPGHLHSGVKLVVGLTVLTSDGLSRP